MSVLASLRDTESGTRPLDPPPVTMQQRELQTWVYKPLRAGPWTIAILIFTLIVFLGVTFSCTLAFFSTQRSLPVPWATLVAFANTLLALLGLLGTLRWWHNARPRLPKLPIHENGFCAGVSDVDLRGTLGDSAADTPAKIGFIVTWISYQIVRVADLIFGYRMPPHLIFNRPFGGSCVDQESGYEVTAAATRTRLRKHTLAPAGERGRTGRSSGGTTMETAFH
ncbi:hypothetical protein LZ30DRAFT_579411 [Colletotrichum cereale]|nr:hypothetical protein LZ30DRAFT_579411 [Colletotrichum cereale]